jgi:hypothetical protein
VSGGGGWGCSMKEVLHGSIPAALCVR